MNKMFPQDQWLDKQATHRVKELIITDGSLVGVSAYFDCEDFLVAEKRVKMPMSPANHVTKVYTAPEGTRALVITTSTEGKTYKQYVFGGA